jgi:hypothetical protein
LKILRSVELCGLSDRFNAPRVALPSSIAA